MVNLHNQQFIHLLLWLSLGMTLELLGLRILDVKVPAKVMEGDSVSLNCYFDLQDKTLYSLNWWRDNDQFYQFEPSDDYQQIVYETPGVYVDKLKSNLKTVLLRNVTKRTAGEFKCEIVADFPSYERDSLSAPLQVVEVPRIPPSVIPHHRSYDVGDHVKANCTVQGASPPPVIHWFLNGKKINEKHIRHSIFRNHKHTKKAKKGHRKTFSFRQHKPRFPHIISHVSVRLRNLQDGRAFLTCTAIYSGVFHRSTEIDLMDPPNPRALDAPRHLATQRKGLNASNLFSALIAAFNCASLSSDSHPCQ